MKHSIDIVAYKCKKCGKLHFPFHDRCLSCKGREFDKVAPQGNAKLLTFSQIFNLPWGFDNRFIFVGVADFHHRITLVRKHLGGNVGTGIDDYWID